MNSVSHSSIKEIAERYSNKLWNEKDLGVIDTFVHQNVVIHSALKNDLHGIQTMKDIVQVWLKGFPDLQVSHDLVIYENDIVIIQWNAEGTHQGEFKGKQPTGNTISYNGVSVYRIQNNQIVEYWAYLDMQHLLSKI